MIKSDRKFGVEIEFIAPDIRSHRSISQRLPVVFDGSLRPYEFGGEYVSQPLTGKEGAHVIENACATLKKYNADVENPKTSFHVHLDGKRFEGELKESKTRDKDASLVIGISNAVMKSVNTGQIAEMFVGGRYSINGAENRTSIGNTIYFSKGRMTKHPRMNYKFFTFEKLDRTQWLKNMFYFYTKHTEVMQAMVSNSRRKGNMYCVPLSDSFDLEEIAECKTIDDIVDVWYKGQGVGGHYDDSRYHNVNFHSYFDRHGTVEIRSHGSTLDARKILLWVRLHQHIADKMETMEFTELQSDKDPFLSFLDVIKDDELLVEYYKRLIGYFSNVTILKDKVIRK